MAPAGPGPILSLVHPRPEDRLMIRRSTALLILASLLVGCGPGATTAPSAPSTGPSAIPSALPSAVPSPTASTSAAPAPSSLPSTAPSASAAAPSAAPSAVPTAGPSATPETTMIVRAYFLLDDRAGGDPALVPVLRTVPRSAATARAALTALLAGPTAKERAATPRIATLVPAATRLLDLDIANGLATVDLSASFAAGGGSFAFCRSCAALSGSSGAFTSGCCPLGGGCAPLRRSP
jgi:hypothetical protein